MSEENFEEAGASLGRLEDYRQQIARAEDLKASIDLNTRVAIENRATSGSAFAIRFYR